MLPSVLWRYWLGGRKGIWPVKNRVVGCWHGCLSGARCRLAYGPADATAPTVSCFTKIQIGFTFLVPAHLGSPGKRAVKQVCVCVSVHCHCVLLFSEKVVLHLLFPASSSQLFPDRRLCYAALCKHSGWLVVCRSYCALYGCFHLFPEFWHFVVFLLHSFMTITSTRFYLTSVAVYRNCQFERSEENRRTDSN